jgi:hypothetical protein
LIGSEWQNFPLVPADGDENILIVPQQQFDVQGYVYHELVAIVILMDYEIDIPFSRQGHLNSKIIASATATRDGNLVSLITIGSTVHIPFDCSGDIKPSKGCYPVELDIRRDHTSDILNVKGLYLEDVLLASSAGAILPHAESMDDEAQLAEFATRHVGHVSFDLALPSEVDDDHDTTSDRGSIHSDMGRDREIHDDVGTSQYPKRAISILRKLSDRKRDDDSVSLVDSLVGGDSEISSLRLDTQVYSQLTSRRDEPVTYRGSSEPKLTTKDSSLMVHSMTLKIKSEGRDAPHSRTAMDGDDQASSRSRPRNRQFTREIVPTSRVMSRGARSLLDRHGLHAAIGDRYPQSRSFPDQAPCDLEVEVRDPMTISEISIQFAGYKHIPSSLSTMEPAKNIHFSYQFYTCMPTRTEVMRLLPSDIGQISVLTRAETARSNETPSALQYIVDTEKNGSASEAYEFAEYLAFAALYVDVWDSDSLFLLGTSVVPLKHILRQGKSVAKYVCECDVTYQGISLDPNGISTFHLMGHNSALISGSGNIVGSVQLILTNSGRISENRDPSRTSTRPPPSIVEMDDLHFNWRVLHDRYRQSAPALPTNGRPRNSVRARPLSQFAPELSKALEDIASHPEAHLKSLSLSRAGFPTANVVSYDEVALLFSMFKGSLKGTVQYIGPFLDLLQVPSSQVSLRKAVDLFRKVGPDRLIEVRRLTILTGSTTPLTSSMTYLISFDRR